MSAYIQDSMYIFAGILLPMMVAHSVRSMGAWGFLIQTMAVVVPFALVVCGNLVMSDAIPVWCMPVAVYMSGMSMCAYMLRYLGQKSVEVEGAAAKKFDGESHKSSQRLFDLMYWITVSSIRLCETNQYV
jgi:hypothetical protein